MSTEANTETTADTNPVSSQTDTSAAEPTPTAEPAPTPSEPGIQIPEYSPEAAAALDAAYSITGATASEPAPNGQQPANPDSSSDYTITFPENFTQDSEAAAFNTILAPIARQSGIDGTAFGKLFADSYAAIESARQQAEWRNRFQQDADLKRDWGADYEANMLTARGHIEFLKQKAGLTDEDLAVFSSPKGMRALYAMAKSITSPHAAGLTGPTESDVSWAAAVMKPGHADYEAFTNPLNPRYKEVNRRWLRAHGH